jgi:hypothetical protein
VIDRRKTISLILSLVGLSSISDRLLAKSIIRLSSKRMGMQAEPTKRHHCSFIQYVVASRFEDENLSGPQSRYLHCPLCGELIGVHEGKVVAISHSNISPFVS